MKTKWNRRYWDALAFVLVVGAILFAYMAYDQSTNNAATINKNSQLIHQLEGHHR
jgi:hypothetical protein